MARPFDTLLIANRGEIACRIIRTARRLGLTTVAVYSDADASAPHVRAADRALRIGPAPALESYLDPARLLAAAAESGAGAIHPGYGFLSENAAFAAACADAGRVFVGPPPEAIRIMGSKIEAKQRVAQAGAPVVPGYPGSDQSDAVLAREAQRIGFPLLIKASAGGGGKGMRRVDDPAGFAEALAGARREAAQAFGDDRVLLERWLREPKHLEVQILADGAGRVLHLFERDCSVQRRHQKLIEEAPGATVSPALRARLGAAAVRIARAVGYQNAGTVEFIAEGEDFYFMEMNTRLQVEHPVTEAITGLDLVEWQLRIAAGESLPFTQEQIRAHGHAIEARVYAENPRAGFLPSAGRLVRVAFAAGARVDSGVEDGSEVSVHYDAMLAKIIAHGESRDAAIRSLDHALQHTELAGVGHNLSFVRAVLRHPAFQSGDYSTQLLDQATDLLPSRDGAGVICAALAVRASLRSRGRWGAADGFRINQPAHVTIRLARDGEPVDVLLGGGVVRVGESRRELSDLAVSREGHARAAVWRLAFRLDGVRTVAGVLIAPGVVHVMRDGDTETFTRPELDVVALADAAHATDRILAPMPGQVLALAVQPGDAVEAGALLLVIEAMKMEHAVRAPRAGVIARVACALGDRVDDGAELIVLEAPAASGPPD